MATSKDWAKKGKGRRGKGSRSKLTTTSRRSRFHPDVVLAQEASGLAAVLEWAATAEEAEPEDEEFAEEGAP